MLFVGVLYVDMRPFWRMRYAHEMRYSAEAISRWDSPQQMAPQSNSSLSDPIHWQGVCCKLLEFPTENQKVPSFNSSYVNNENISVKMFDFAIVFLEEYYIFAAKMFIINFVVQKL